MDFYSEKRLIGKSLLKSVLKNVRGKILTLLRNSCNKYASGFYEIFEHCMYALHSTEG